MTCRVLTAVSLAPQQVRCPCAAASSTQHAAQKTLAGAARAGRHLAVEELDRGVHAIGKKIVEEASEVWMAAEHEGNERLAEEISQEIYHLQVMMIKQGLSLDDVYKHL